VFVEKVKGSEAKKLEKKKDKERVKKYKKKITDSSEEDLKSALKEINDDCKLSDKRKQKLKTRILSKPNVSPEVLEELKKDRNQIIKWLAHDYEYSKSDTEPNMSLKRKSR